MSFLWPHPLFLSELSLPSTKPRFSKKHAENCQMNLISGSNHSTNKLVGKCLLDSHSKLKCAQKKQFSWQGQTSAQFKVCGLVLDCRFCWKLYVTSLQRPSCFYCNRNLALPAWIQAKYMHGTTTDVAAWSQYWPFFMADFLTGR